MSAPIPSGRVHNVRSLIQNQVHLTGQTHDEYFLQNAHDPRLRNDPRLHEVLARTFNMQLNKELEQATSKINESMTTIDSLQQTNTEQLDALAQYKNNEHQLKDEVKRLRSDNEALNKTLIDITINQTGDLTITEDSSE